MFQNLQERWWWQDTFVEQRRLHSALWAALDAATDEEKRTRGGSARDQIRNRVQRMLPSFLSLLGPATYPRFAYLCYYSQILPSEYEEERKESKARISRVAATAGDSLEEDQLQLPPGAEELLKTENEYMGRFLLPTQASQLATEDEHSIPPQYVEDALATALGRVERLPCMPANIAEALRIDWHLPSRWYYAPICELVLKGHPSSQRVSEGRHWYKIARVMPAMAETHLFSKDTREDFRKRLKGITQKEPVLLHKNKGKTEDMPSGRTDSTTSDLLEVIFGGTGKYDDILLEIEAPNLSLTGEVEVADTEEARGLGKTLQTLAYRLLLGRCGDENEAEELVSGDRQAWTLRRLLKKVDSHHDKPVPVRRELIPLRNHHWFRDCPSLAFFLTAMLYDGTYRDMLDYMVPALCMGSTELDVETVDLCPTFNDFLRSLALDFDEIELIRKKHRMPDASRQTVPDDYRTAMESCLIRRISDHGCGNLSVLWGAGAAYDPKENRLAEDNGCLPVHMPEIKERIRTTFIPIREQERIVDIAWHEKQQTITLATAYKYLIHDLRGNLRLAGKLLGGSPEAGGGFKVKEPVQLRYFLRDDAPDEILCSATESTAGDLANFWKPLAKKQCRLTGLDDARKRRRESLLAFSHISDEVNLMGDFLVWTTNPLSTRESVAVLKDVSNEDLLKAWELACQLSHRPKPKNVILGIPSPFVCRQQNITFLTMAIKMALGNAKKFSGDDRWDDATCSFSVDNADEIVFTVTNPVNQGYYKENKGTGTRLDQILRMGEWLYGDRFISKKTEPSGNTPPSEFFLSLKILAAGKE